MRAALFLCVLLAGCASGPAPLSTYNPLTNPPWEAFVRPGPGAEKDVDFETLNGPSKIAMTQPDVAAGAEADTGQAAAAQPVVQPEPEPAKPKKPVSKDAEIIKAVAVLPVKGAGGPELTTAMRSVLGDTGWPVLAKSRKDAIAIQGEVSLTPPQAGNQTVKLVWTVTTPSGKNLGDVRQENTVPAGSLDGGWGDNAAAATQAAAEGISKLIEKYR